MLERISSPLPSPGRRDGPVRAQPRAGPRRARPRSVRGSEMRHRTTWSHLRRPSLIQRFRARRTRPPSAREASQPFQRLRVREPIAPVPNHGLVPAGEKLSHATHVSDPSQPHDGVERDNPCSGTSRCSRSSSATGLTSPAHDASRVLAKTTSFAPRWAAPARTRAGREAASDAVHGRREPCCRSPPPRLAA